MKQTKKNILEIKEKDKKFHSIKKHKIVEEKVLTPQAPTHELLACSKPLPVEGELFKPNAYKKDVRFHRSDSLPMFLSRDPVYKTRTTNTIEIENQLTLFILPRQRMNNEYQKPYYTEEYNNIIYYTHLHVLFDPTVVQQIKEMSINKTVINVILLGYDIGKKRSVSDKKKSLSFDTLIEILLSLNTKAIYRFIIGAVYGLFMHQYIFKFPKRSIMITLSDYCCDSAFDTHHLYETMKQSVTIELLLENYILFFEERYYTPSIFISSSQGIISLFSLIKNKYYMDPIPVLKNPSIKQMSTIFITNGIPNYEIKAYRILWNLLYNEWLQHPTLRQSNIRYAHEELEDFLQVLKYNRRDPLEIIRDLNIIFHNKKELEEYLIKLNEERHICSYNHQIYNSFPLTLRINKELMEISFVELLRDIHNIINKEKKKIKIKNKK